MLLEKWIPDDCGASSSKKMPDLPVPQLPISTSTPREVKKSREILTNLDRIQVLVVVLSFIFMKLWIFVGISSFDRSCNYEKFNITGIQYQNYLPGKILWPNNYLLPNLGVSYEVC